MPSDVRGAAEDFSCIIGAPLPISLPSVAALLARIPPLPTSPMASDYTYLCDHEAREQVRIGGLAAVEATPRASIPAGLVQRA